MVKNGANINFKDKVNQTPLFYAAREGKVDTVLAILDLGGDINH